jgi:riboflavin kinase
MGGKKTALECIITSGLEEGAFFMSMQHYKDEIRKKLGFDAYPGTLNLKVDEKELKSLSNTKSIRIEGYRSGSKKFGGARCFKAKIKNVNGAIIIPDLTKHKGIIEFISSVHLRSKLNLNDGDKIRVELP